MTLREIAEEQEKREIVAYRVRQFRELFDPPISNSAFYAWRRAGKIKTFQIGGATFVPASERERVLAGEAV
jgi:hypothetical protein